MSTFLPKDYEAPKGGGSYMKFIKGTNRFRVLSDAIVGWEYWIDTPEGKRHPVRVRTFDEVPAEFRMKSEKGAKHFWAFTVYNYTGETVQILEITQVGIMNYIEGLVHDEDWGDPKAYDLVVVKSGDGMDTKYQTNPKPHSKLDIEIPEIELEALFRGEDPFNNVNPETIDVGDEEHTVMKKVTANDDTIDIEQLLEEIDGQLPTQDDEYIKTQEGAKHSRRYFAEAKNANITAENAQKLVKAKFKLGSYTEVTAEQLDHMIEFMKERSNKEGE
jgi:hypothetical protein